MVPKLPCPVASAGSRNLLPYSSIYSAERLVYLYEELLQPMTNAEPQTWLLFLPAFYSFFYGGTMGTYLSLHFSVRARALSSLIIR